MFTHQAALLTQSGDEKDMMKETSESSSTERTQTRKGAELNNDYNSVWPVVSLAFKAPRERSGRLPSAQGGGGRTSGEGAIEDG